MKIRDALLIALRGLTAHKSRSLLTILGIVIGVASITLVMSLGQSAQNLIVGEIKTLKPENVFVLPGRQPTGISSMAGTLLSDSLKQKDFEDLQKKSNVPDAVNVVPLVFSPVSVTYESEVYNATLLGSTDGILDMFSLEIADGTFFSTDDILQKAGVAVIGQKVANSLFGPSSAIGQKIKIKDKSLHVIGILKSKGQTPFVDFDEVVLTPYSTAQQYILGIRYFHRLTVEASSVEAIPGMVKDITFLLRNNHNITDPAKDDFNVKTQTDLVGTLSTVTNVFTLFLSLVAAISLIVGGIGIMNIMLVSVTERTKEIGLRKALGATNKNILYQFLTEAIFLTVSGGIIGILTGTTFGLLTTYVINTFYGINFTFEFPFFGAALGVIISSLIGFVFGIFPARQASLKSPIEALRYE
jgi:putative ABC transport system permease protein